MTDCDVCGKPILGRFGWTMRQGVYYHHHCDPGARIMEGYCGVCKKPVFNDSPRLQDHETNTWLHVSEQQDSCYLIWRNNQTKRDE